jgi:hypothetical protein
VTIEQRIAQQLADSLTDAEFDVLEAEAQADAIPFRDGGPVPSSRPAIPLGHDGRRPGMDTRCCDLPADWESQLGAELADMRAATRRIRKLAR